MSGFNVVDPSGWIECFADGSNADFFESAIEDGEGKGLRVVEPGAELALEAAKVSREEKIPMADSITLATARKHDATLWTRDSDFEGMEGVRYVGKK